MMISYYSMEMSTQRQIQLQCICWQQTVPNRYMEIKFNFGLLSVKYANDLLKSVRQPLEPPQLPGVAQLWTLSEFFFNTNLFSPFVRISMSPGNVRWCRTRAATAPPVAGVQEKMSPLRKARKKEILSRLIAATFIFFLFLSFWGVLNGVNAQSLIE